MKTILVTGSKGFVGKNLLVALSRRDDVKVLGFDVDDDEGTLDSYLREADIVYHLAGVNRPKNENEFQTGNAGLTERIVASLQDTARRVPIVLTSSTQAALDNPYGISKKAAEEAVFAYGRETVAPVYVFRFTNVFGKWSRPNYNSVVSTFCHNIAHGLDITISDPAREMELVYIDDIVAEFTRILDGSVPGSQTWMTVNPTYRITLRDLADKIFQFRDIRKTLVIPDLSDEFTRKLHATYLSYLDKEDFSYPLEIKTDNRGALAELIKSEGFGQMFVSRTYGHITRGNHYHNTKVERFCVLQGEAVIRFRHILDNDVIEYPVSGNKWEVVDIPPGYTHHIENLSDGEMIVLFWANQLFDPENPDTCLLPVEPGVKPKPNPD
jgi:UDP-2-acetamido-2,6-beta-L-arabino-hexul-4-ose reductase